MFRSPIYRDYGEEERVLYKIVVGGKANAAIKSSAGVLLFVRTIFVHVVE